ncbi:MAG: translation initiation factor IF-2, partial [Rhodothermales bacterium]
MPKFKKVRLFKISKELNVSVDTLVQLLKDTGHAKALSGSGLNASVEDEEAYDKLMEAFASDKAVATRVKEKRAARQAEILEDEHEVAVAEEVEEAEPVRTEIEIPVETAPIEIEEVEAPVEIVAEPEPEEEPVTVEAPSQPGDGGEVEVRIEEVEPAEAVEEPEEVVAEATPEAEPAVAEPTGDGEAAPEEEVLSAKRYQLAGTKVMGKVDLAG